MIKSKDDLEFRRKMALAIPTICLIVYVLLGYFLQQKNVDHAYLYSLVVFIFVPFNYIIVGLKKFSIGYPTLITIIYFLVCFIVKIGAGLSLWHPLWVLFLTIPLYYIFFGHTKIKFGKEKDDFIDYDADK